MQLLYGPLMCDARFVKEILAQEQNRVFFQNQIKKMSTVHILWSGGHVEQMGGWEKSGMQCIVGQRQASHWAQ